LATQDQPEERGYDEANDENGQHDEIDAEDAAAIESLHLYDPEHRQAIMAIVRNAKFKANKGGKGGKGGKGFKGSYGGKGERERRPPAAPGPGNGCHGCGSEEHFLRDCPNVTDPKARSAAKAAGKGRGTSVSMGQQFPTQRSWNNMYPGPTKGQWADY
jgi:hypothetical protein